MEGLRHIGLHVKKPKIILAESPLSAIAFFLGSNRAWAYRQWNDKQVKLMTDSLRVHPVLDPTNILIHGNYLANLTSSTEETITKAIIKIKVELETMDLLGLHHYVHHPGTLNKGDRQVQLQKYMDNLIGCMTESKCNVLIENMASHTRLGSTISDLQWMMEHIPSNPQVDPRRVCLCLDTAHSWGAGWPMDQWGPLKRDLKTRGIWKNVKGIHLNGSKAQWNSGRDLHKNVMSLGDQIPQTFWDEFLRDGDVHGLPCITETKEPEVMVYRQKLIDFSKNNNK
jgi:apurinic endonuclease APN1